MKKTLILLFFALISIQGKAQYAKLDAILTILEERKGMNQNLQNVNIDNKKFIIIKDFEDHTERKFIVIKGNKATFVEIFDDKKTGESASNVFSGDIIRTRKNMISLRADQLEGKKIPIPITKTMLLTKQREILYLVDVNSKERWIDEASFSKEK